MFITKHPKIILLAAVILLVPSVIGYALTGVNYDILSYLPEDINSVQGEKILDETFHNASSVFLVVENFKPDEVVKLKEEISGVEYVTKVMWSDDILDITVPQSSLPSAVRKIFYSQDGNATLLLINLSCSSSSDEAAQAIHDIRNIADKDCFISGMSAILTDTKELADSEAPIYIAFAIMLALIVLSFTSSSWILPFVLLTSLGFAVVYNMGTNFVFGSISFITQSIAAILQLGVTMDYSVFLMDRFEEEMQHRDNRQEAMAAAVSSTFSALLGSSLTTIFGFLAMCFMQLSLGFDIGIVMAKGVVFGIITVVTVLPSLVLIFYKPIFRFNHRRFVPGFGGLVKFTLKRKKRFLALVLILIIPFYLAQTSVEKYYNVVSGLPRDLESVTSLDKMKDDFNMSNSYFIIIDKETPSGMTTSMIEEMKKVDGIETVVAMGEYIGAGIPASILPYSIRAVAESGDYQMMMVNSSYETGTQKLNVQIDALKEIVEECSPGGYITGEGVLTKDLITVADNDFIVTSILSIATIFILIAIVFKSISIPFILVLMIELSIWINIGLSYITGSSISFITPTVISCVQLGATVDYAILMTTRFKEELNSGKDKKTAIHDAASSSCVSIFQSALVFFSATIGVYFICDITMIKEICSLLARGSFISAVMIMLCLPPILLILEKVISKTSYKWNTGKEVK